MANSSKGSLPELKNLEGELRWLGKLAWVRQGTTVTFELAKNGMFPRWHMGIDRGGSGDFSPGIIESVREGVCYVRSSFFERDESGELSGEPQVILWRWPLPGHPEYKESLWGSDGYLEPLF